MRSPQPPSYLVRHLGEHLETGPLDELIPLASIEWRAAWDGERERYRGHERDLRFVQQALRRATFSGNRTRAGGPRTQRSGGQPGSSADDQLEQALATPPLVAALVLHGVWTLAEHWPLVRGLPTLESKATALGLIAPLTIGAADQALVSLLSDVSRGSIRSSPRHSRDAVTNRRPGRRWKRSNWPASGAQGVSPDPSHGPTPCAIYCRPDDDVAAALTRQVVETGPRRPADTTWSWRSSSTICPWSGPVPFWAWTPSTHFTLLAAWKSRDLTVAGADPKHGVTKLP